MNMREKIGLRVRRSLFGDVAVAEGGPVTPAELQAADDILDAIREPTPEMERAAKDADSLEDSAMEAYHRIIDAAKAER